MTHSILICVQVIVNAIVNIIQNKNGYHILMTYYMNMEDRIHFIKITGCNGVKGDPYRLTH